MLGVLLMMKFQQNFDLYGVHHFGEFSFDDLELIGITENHCKPYDRRNNRLNYDGHLQRYLSNIKVCYSMSFEDYTARPTNFDTKSVAGFADNASPVEKFGGLTALSVAMHKAAALKAQKAKTAVAVLPVGVQRAENAEDLTALPLDADGSVILPAPDTDIPDGVKRHNRDKNRAKNARAKKARAKKAAIKAKIQLAEEVRNASKEMLEEIGSFKDKKPILRKDHRAKIHSH